jgi:hypothetical protein
MKAYCCDKLCSGECCEWLQNALADPLDPDGCTCPECQAYDAVRSPAKLAELLAMALRARGLWASIEAWNEGAYSPATQRVEITKTHYRLWADASSAHEVDHEWSQCVGDVCEHYILDIDAEAMTKARAFVAAIVATPPEESSRGQCERIVRGES